MKKILRKTLLYKSGVEYADFCVNHIEGCAHGCRFPCYAMMMKRRCGVIKDYGEWIEPKIVANALELLDREIPKFKDKIRFVHLCFSTDPFMYRYPEITSLTLDIIEKLNKNDIRCTVLTKGVYPGDLANTNKYGKDNEYGITVVSLNEGFKKRFEPYSAPYRDRIESLRYLYNRGLKTWVSMEPYPTPNLVRQDLLRMLEEISFVDKVVFGKLNYNIKSRQSNDSKRFYENCANTVIGFCRNNGIEYHIKNGTKTKNDKNTEGIFATKNTSVENEKQLSLVL